MSFRRYVLVTHRWLGLPASAIVAVTGATGALLVWPGSYLLRRVAGRLHENLAMGRVGAWIVLVTTVAAVILQLGGLFLWWKRKTLAVHTHGGWRRAVFDLHHSAGALALLLMLTISVSAIGMAVVKQQRHPELRRVVVNLHTARAFPQPVKVLYTIGSLCFLIQGLSGLAIWWGYRKA